MLGALVDHSLISVQERNAEARYILLETVRQYTLEKLKASGEFLTLQDRHLAYFREFAVRGTLPVSMAQPDWIERFEIEYDNFRASMEYAIVHHPESAIVVEYPLTWLCDCTYRLREAYDWAMRILASTEAWPPGNLHVRALWHAGDRALMIGERQQGQALMEAGLEMARELGDKDLTAYILHDLVAMCWVHGDLVKFREYVERYMTISQELGDKIHIQNALWGLGESISLSWDKDTGRIYLEQSLELARQDNHPNGIQGALSSLARVARLEGDNARAKDLYIECAQIRRQMEYRIGLAYTLINLGRVFLQEGYSIQASAVSEESLAIFRELKMLQGQVYCLAGFAGAAGIDGQDERAAHLFGATEAAAERLNLKMYDFDHTTYYPIIAAIRERLGKAAFNAAW
ncbi:MAG: hypothetical protein ABSG01_00360 [Anaerolineales bacterium]